MILKKIDYAWKAVGQNAFEYSMAFMLVGIALTLASYAIGVADVTFTGAVEGKCIDGLDTPLSKQVGYIWAPNWAFAGIILLPSILLCLALARATIEPTLVGLIEAGMLRRSDGDPVNKKEVLALWSQRSTSWMIVAVAGFLIVFIAVIPIDFVMVVGRWLLDPAYAASEAQKLTLQHPDFEFDWSISALFSDAANPTIPRVFEHPNFRLTFSRP